MARSTLIYSLTIAACLYGACGFPLAFAVDVPTGEQIISGVLKRSEKQDCALQEYTVTRRYTLQNRHLDGDASLTVLLKYQAGHGKQFSIVHSAGPGVAQHALVNLVRDEEKSSRAKASDNAFNPEKYRLTMLGKEAHEGRQCYRFRIEPRQDDKMLINGELWVDAQDLAVVEIKGHPVRSLGFWIGKPLIDQHFAPVEGFWMPSGNETSAQIRLAGDTELKIEYSDYKFKLPSLSMRRQ